VSEPLARTVASLVASWERYATWSPGARLLRDADAAIGVFPHGADRDVFNNALVLGDPQRALHRIRQAYGEAGVDHYAVWVHESRRDAGAVLEAAGLQVVERTLAMAAQLPAAGPARLASVPIAAASPATLLAVNSLPADLLPDMRPDGAARILAAGEPPVAGLLALDHAGDCTLAFVATLPSARRRGLATALTVRALADAAARGCTTASLQATLEAEGVYRAAGFVGIGRFREYAIR